jgi:hypothetical protein
MLCTWARDYGVIGTGAGTIELLASFGHLNYDVVEMVSTDKDSWDRYEAAK